MENKRALSGVVTTLIIILLVIVAAGIVWAVVENMLSEGTEEISLGKFTINFEIEKVTVAENSVDVKVKRNPGEGEISGINFIISDGVNSEVIEKPTTIQQLGEQTFTLDYSGLVKEISIVPVFKSESGKEQVGNEVDKFEFSNKQIIENLGAVSWWRFEGNANDEVGGNHGTKFGEVDCNVEGKFGKACSFDGISGYVNVPNIDKELDLNEYTISFWAKLENDYSDPSTEYVFISNSNYHQNYEFQLRNGCAYFNYRNPEIQEGYTEDCRLTIVNKFAHYVWVSKNDGTNILYLNKEEIYREVHNPGDHNPNSHGILYIGKRYDGSNFPGIIDEPMIFNKALTEEQVKALYELNLN